MMWRCFGWGIALCAAVLGSPGLRAQSFTQDELQRILQSARLSQSAYDDNPLQPFGDRRAGMWRLRSEASLESGLDYKLFERRSADGRVEWELAFAGTEDGKDWRSNIAQSTMGKTQQYEDALRVARDLHKTASERGIKMTATGHSLGGSMAQAVSFALGIKSVVFDAAPLSKAYANGTPAEMLRAHGNVTNIRLKGDPVSKLWGTQLGAMHTIEPAPSVLDGLVPPISPLASGIRAVQSHNHDRLITSIEHTAAALPRTRQGGRSIPMLSSPGLGENRELASRAMALHASGARSVLIYGDGADADFMAREMGRRLGVDNVHRIRETLSDHQLQQRAGGLGVDHVLGFKSSWPQQSSPHGRFMLPRREVEKFVSRSLSIAGGLHNLSVARFGETARTAKLDERFELLGKANDFYQIARGVENDLRTASAGDFTFVRSEALAEITKQVMDYAESQGLKKWIGKEVNVGLSELARSAASRVSKGRFDLQSATDFWDGINKGAWATLGSVAFAGNPRAIKAFVAFGDTAANVLRDASYDIFRRNWSAASGTDGVIIEQWRLSQQNRVRANAPIQSLSKYLEINNINLGMSARQIARIDQLETPTLQRYQSQIHGVPPRPFSEQNRRPPPIVRMPYTPQHRQPGSELESRLTTRMHSHSQRALVVGHGPEADRLQRNLEARVGAPNVHRVRTNPHRSVLGRIADAFRAEAVYSATPVMTRVETRSHYSVRRSPISRPDTWSRTPVSTGPTFQAGRSPGVGGVMLDASAEVAHSAEMLASGRFSLLFENPDQGVSIRDLRRFVTALWATYFSKEGPGISIDPIAPNVDRHMVRYIGEVINSDLGRVMRVADYTMKEWAIGTSRPDLPGFENPDDIANRIGKLCRGGTSRFWFVPDQMRFHLAGGMLLFDSGRMLLKTETENAGGRVDVANQEFARRFSASYPAIAERYPIYQELFEYAKLISLSKFLVEKEVPMLWYLLANKELIITEDSPGTVAELVKESDHFPQLTIKGGVDLKSPRSAAKYVRDDVAARALAQAQRAAGASAVPEVRVTEMAGASANSAITAAAAHDVTLATSGVGGDVYQTDLAFREDGRPGLELVRYYSPDYTGPATFGDAWHLAIPYRLQPADDARREFRGVRVPERLTVENRLSGSTEVLSFDDSTYQAVGYVPDRVEESTVLGVFFLTDGSFRLVDKLGSQFHFDPTGEVVAMLLTDEYKVEFEYGSQQREATAEERAGFSLSSAGDHRSKIGHIELPTRLQLSSEGSIATRFVLDIDNPDDDVEYVPEDRASPFTHVSVMVGGSFVLHERGGRRLAFDPGGRLAHVGARTVERMVKGDTVVAFDYEFAGFDCRITRARVTNGSGPAHVVAYEYANGELASASVGGRKIEIQHEAGRVVASE